MSKLKEFFLALVSNKTYKNFLFLKVIKNNNKREKFKESAVKSNKISHE